MQPFNGNPPDRLIQNDDIVVLDFGPIFEGLKQTWEELMFSVMIL
jgi:hypothetical protein